MDAYWCDNCREVQPDPGFTFFAPDCEVCGTTLEEIKEYEPLPMDHKEVDMSYKDDWDDPGDPFDEDDDDDDTDDDTEADGDDGEAE